MSRLFTRLSLAFLPLLFSGGAGADVYKYVDRFGNVSYTDNPEHSGYRRIIETPPAFSRPMRISFGAGRNWRRGGSGILERNRRQYEGLISEAASQHGLDPALLHAVIRAESAYNPGAVSNKGAVGLMQLMPGTAARYGVRDPYDPEENVWGGARYLSDLMDMFQSDVALAVAAYNAGENNVIKYGNRIPPFQETQDYVAKVLEYYNR
jgi:hypothetical protein